MAKADKEPVELLQQFNESLKGGPSLDEDSLEYLFNYYQSKGPKPNKNRPEYYMPGSHEWNESPQTLGKLHARNRVGQMFLTDETQRTLIAFGIISTDDPPASLGKMINWGNLTRASEGTFQITLGNNGVSADKAQTIITLISGGPDYTVTTQDTTDTLKTFVARDVDGLPIEGETITYKFSIYRMPFST